MKHIIIFATLVSLCHSQPTDQNGNVVLQQDPANSGAIIGPTICQPTDPRRLLVTPSDYAVMAPYYDSRGAARWKYQAGHIVYVDPASRPAVDPDRALDAVAEFLRRRAALVQAQALGWDTSKPVLYARLQRWVQEAQDQATALLRAGQAADDPVPPSKTTITTQ